MKYETLSTAAEIDGWAEELRKSKKTSIALDFEGEFNLHVYGEKLCLIQISDGTGLWIIDPFEADLAAVKRLLGDEKIMKIMWDASSDMSLAENGYDIIIKSVLDLRPAADLLELPKKDLSSVCRDLLGMESSGSKGRFQKYNWIRRPIDPEAVEYALGDVAVLHRLKDVILSRLAAEVLVEEYIRQNLIVQNRNYKRVPGQRHKKMKGYKYLKSAEKARLKILFELRDGFARNLNWPPHRVIPNPDMLELARLNIGAGNISFDQKLGRAVRTEIETAVESALNVI